MNLIFDIWNTLYNGISAVISWFVNASHMCSLSYSSDELYLLYKNIYISKPIPYWDIVLGEVEHFKELSKIIWISSPNSFYQSYQAWVLKNLVLFPFVKEALSSLKNDNWNLFILSNGRQVNQVFKLQHRGIKNLFKAIYTSERIQVEKPNLLAFNFLLQHENLDINETWMIWDSLDDDILPAESLWIKTLLFNMNSVEDSFLFWGNFFTSYKDLLWILHDQTKK